MIYSQPYQLIIYESMLHTGLGCNDFDKCYHIAVLIPFHGTIGIGGKVILQ